MNWVGEEYWECAPMCDMPVGRHASDCKRKKTQEPKACPEESYIDGRFHISFTDEIHPEAKRLFIDHLGPALTHFLNKAEDYGWDNPAQLGLRGQFADIWRKVAKLKRSIWDGHELSFEGVPEIFKDLIGHSLLSLREEERERERGTD